MFQVTFSNQALSELKKLEPITHLAALEPLGKLKAEDLMHPREPINRFKREGKVMYRLRDSDLRYYFTVKDDSTLLVLYILHEHSLEDFLLRNRLPVSEHQLFEQDSKFWRYLENLTKN